MTTLRFLDQAPRFLFFTGKGGVGKTSIACASAVRLAEGGASVLLVSTDPASNVGQVFGVSIGNTVTAIDAVPGLSALEIDPEQAAQQYRERIVGPVRGLLPPAEVASIEEQLSGACTTEIASFNEFTDLLTDAAWTAAYDHILFDTAPTGHTIRLLQLPGSWTDFLTEGTGDASCLGPLSGLEKQRAVYAEAVAALADQARTRLVLVARAQTSTLTEAARTHAELAGIGMARQYLVVNGILPDGVDGGSGEGGSGGEAVADPLFAAIRAREQQALAQMPDALRAAPTDYVALKSSNMVGLAALRGLLEPEVLPAAGQGEHAAPSAALPDSPLSALVDEIAAGGHGLVMLMGKGGVGKTTLAASVAVALAARGLPVHLTTTDPAAHLTDTLAGGAGSAEVRSLVSSSLKVSRIDPAAEIQRYTDTVLRTKGAHLDEQGLAMLREDLRSPCTEEIAVFQAFSRVIREAKHKFVVMDTAPTGHTLLLLDATGSYHREIQRQLGGTVHLTTPMMKLQDPEQTKVILVTLAETTPVLEAAELQADLERAGITPWAWVVNNSLAAAAPASPLLLARARNELPEIEHVQEKRAARLAVVPLLADEPVGIPALLALATSPLPAALPAVTRP
ncbi:arsenical pump-driving ATPase [Cryobacterium sp. TMT1-21]|uniref:Arsenical pump-driving ATPase n=1 Tax=Cryobacterium shii TaxID=1259235 RepID=A0AAQ2C950_9MICO|nr:MULTISPECIES: arsenical pump-driving ATPase [Cryobacterium]TFC53085.1 arsenical pump-driving ATPase [Cryobacterium shii]TFC88785.1 arsenical pump-driving ATPase [Cryobacterium sp. TmT2-59]TFD17740.1 arsenical pump-driving ATPase [Cryobacterium sp. TMT1-21]TFD20590.1 arsenical pump-driving ATPase [Cryobacterium sp. TMT4-10]TFD27627.1 arsenical pump-driving ATPase [Cryobacterium sp. TMT2-23]